MLSVTIFGAILLDYILGEPKRFHPLVGFGKITTYVERALNNSQTSNAKVTLKTKRLHQKLLLIYGMLGWSILVLPLTIILIIVINSLATGWHECMEILILYFCIAHRSLLQHSVPIREALDQQQLEKARSLVDCIVSRNSDRMSPQQVRNATIESLLENGNDAIFAPLFWFIVAGAPGALLFRLSNTLDAMWGYKTKQYRYFGWCAARIDDALNYIPARCTALSYALLGSTKQSLHSWREHAKLCASPNAGPVMCAGAGSLKISLGGPAWYHGELVKKPELGIGEAPENYHITRASHLVSSTLLMWFIGICLIEFSIYYFL